MSDPQARTPTTPLSVWVTGQQDGRTQLVHGGYVPDTAVDQARIPPAVAAYAIAHYTRPGALVLDPDCGAGTVLVEALRAGRHAIGLTSDAALRQIARANLTAAWKAGTFPEGMVLDDSTDSGTALADPLTGVIGRVDLVVTTARHAHTSRTVHAARPADSPDVPACITSLADALARCRPLLRPGGHAVVTLRPWREDGELLDLAGDLSTAAHHADLVPVERCVALLGRVHGNRITTRTSPSQRRFAGRYQRTTGLPIHRLAHHDVIIFRAPSSRDNANDTTQRSRQHAHRRSRGRTRRAR